MKIFGYIDSVNQGWNDLLIAAGKKLGVPVTSFTRADEVPDEEDVAVFVHMSHYPIARREYDKQMMEDLAKKSKIHLIPNRLEGQLYDNKILQYQTFDGWMPKTYYETSYEKAKKLAKTIKYPFVSKASEGAGSSNIRFIQNREQALAEARKAFSDDGIILWIKNRQKGYVLWQEYLPQVKGNDWRIVLIAKKYAMIKERFIKDKNHPFASGSDKFRTVFSLNDDLRLLLNHTYAFANEFDLTLVCVDIIYDADGKPIILENSNGWGMYAYRDCPWFEKNLSNYWPKTKYVGDDMFEIVVKAIMEDKEMLMKWCVRKWQN